MAIVRVQTPAGAFTSAAATTQTNTFGSNVTAGNLIVAAASASTTAGPTITFSSTGSPTWVKTNQFFESGASNLFAIGYCQNCPGGATTVTATYSASLSLRCLIVAEYSGAATSSVLDQSTTGKSTAAVTNPTDDAMVTTANGDLIFVAFSFRNATSPASAGSGYSMIAVDQASGIGADFGAEDIIQASAGSISATFTVTGGSLGSGIMSAAFKAAAVAGIPDVNMAPIVVRF